MSCQFEEKTSEISTGGCSQSTGYGNQTINLSHRRTVEILGGKVADRRGTAAESPSIKQDEEEKQNKEEVCSKSSKKTTPKKLSP